MTAIFKTKIVPSNNKMIRRIAVWDAEFSTTVTFFESSSKSMVWHRDPDRYGLVGCDHHGNAGNLPATSRLLSHIEPSLTCGLPAATPFFNYPSCTKS